MKTKNTKSQKKTAGINENTGLHEPHLSKKDFRENPAVEQLYKTIYDYKLREEAYKTAIKIYIDLKS